jgi:uncharacterized protein (DUF3084 family)
VSPDRQLPLLNIAIDPRSEVSVQASRPVNIASSPNASARRMRTAAVVSDMHTSDHLTFLTPLLVSRQPLSGEVKAITARL